MKLILKKGQSLVDVFSPAARSKVFPPAAFAASGKRLDARKFVGIIKLTDDAVEIQKTMRDEWSQNPD